MVEKVKPTELDKRMDSIIADLAAAIKSRVDEGMNIELAVENVRESKSILKILGENSAYMVLRTAKQQVVEAKLKEQKILKGKLKPVSTHANGKDEK